MASGLPFFLMFLSTLGRQPQSGVVRQGGNPTERTSPFRVISPTPPQPRRSRLSFNFSPSRQPPGAAAGANQFLRNGLSSLIKSCSRPNRVPCALNSNNRGECVRRGCCWNPAHPIRCARATFFVVSLREENFAECGIPAGELLPSSPKDPPFDDLALALLINQRIVGGVQAPEGEWPWTVLIYLRPLGIPAGQVCGGSLVSDRWIVTAAHCIETPDPNLYSVALGINNLITLTGNEVIRDVQSIVFDTSAGNVFDDITFDNDVVLLELNAPVNFTRYIRPICIVPSGTPTDSNTSPTFAGLPCITVGWGNLTSPLGPTSTTLQQLGVTINPNLLCQSFTFANSAAYDSRPVLQDSLLSPKFCATGTDDPSNQDSCVGDSGGPLFCLHDDGRYYLHGITSYGTVPCAIGLPGIYTKVALPSINNFITSNVFT